MTANFRLLHITDLHCSEDPSSLSSRWSDLASQLGPVDFVAITGDLTRRAHPDEFNAVRRFLQEHVLQLVTDRSRVVIVPGNHDVAWCGPEELGDAHCATPANLRMGPVGDVGHLVNGPGGFRCWLPDSTALRWVELDRQRYARARFQAFQDFSNEFYADTIRSPSRAFELTSPDPALHWSAHVFEGLAIYGFNSCHENDALWTGAGLSRAALAAAQKHKEQHGKGRFCLALWHHGLSSEPGRLDRIGWDEVATLEGQGFHLGLHGHTHKDEFNDLRGWEDLRELRRAAPLPIIATGSLGAPWGDRPEGLWNQASLVEVAGVDIFWTLYELKNGRWRANQPLRYEMQDTSSVRATSSKPPMPPRPVEVRARRHRREVCVDVDGIAKVDVTLEGLSASAPVTLATLLTRCVDADAEAKWRSEDGSLAHTLQISRKDETNQRSAYRVVPSGAGQIPRLTWSYCIANAFALTRTDCSMQNGRDRLGFLDDGEDAVVHELRFPSAELSIELQVPFRPSKHRAVVQALTDDGEWLIDDAETRACSIRLLGEDSPSKPPSSTDRPQMASPSLDPTAEGGAWRIVMTVLRPREGRRYALVYTPEERLPELSGRVFRRLRDIIHRCRDLLNGDGVTKHVNARIEEAICSCLQIKEADRLGGWVAHLWHPDHHRLLACFGNCPDSARFASFRYGQGVAGHAFRCFGPTMYYQPIAMEGTLSPASRRRLLLHESNPLWPNYPWLLCVPLTTLGAHPTPIGVLGFADYPQQPRWDAFEGITRESFGRNAPTARGQDRLNRLIESVSNALWIALAEKDDKVVALLAEWTQQLPAEDRLYD